MKYLLPMPLLLFVVFSCDDERGMALQFECAETSVRDIDGNCYNTVKIGGQTWMAENLKVTRYRNGDEIPTDHSNDDWRNLSTGAFSIYGDSETNTFTYGYLYNWYTVDDDRNICPEGWHVPTDNNWSVLTDYLGGIDVAGGKMKSTGTIDSGDGIWLAPNSYATDESGFTGLPGGYRIKYDGTYSNINKYGYFWSSTDFNNSSAWSRRLDYDISSIYRGYFYYKNDGLSIRCIKD